MSPLIKTGPDGRTIMSHIAMSVVAVLFIGYTVFQARFLIAGPRIALTDSPPLTQTNRVVTLTGDTKNIVVLTLNGREIYTDKHGVFEEPLVLENGYTVATLTAHDRYGRTTSLTKSFVYEPAVARADTDVTQ